MKDRHEAETMRCSCEWRHPVTGEIDPSWPAEVDPGCEVHRATLPTLLVISCDRCGELQGTPAGNAQCVNAPEVVNPAFPEDIDHKGHDWSGMHEWPLARCRVCGCTDLDCSGCIEKTGAPCSWIPELETDEGPICSACVSAEPEQRGG